LIRLQLCDDFESLESFIDSVSYLTKTADLTLWKILKNGFFKDLQKEIKKQQRAQLRMSRILRCEEAAMNDDEGIPQRRSLRNRRSVNYSMLDVSKIVMALTVLLCRLVILIMYRRM
jgi:hypothetical protein